MSAIKDAVEAILSTYGDPLRVAKDYVIDNGEIINALKDAEQGSDVAYALNLLAQVNPPKAKEVKT